LPAERAIAMAGLTEQATKRIGTLSGGQRQRLYFALAICGIRHPLPGRAHRGHGRGGPTRLHGQHPDAVRRGQDHRVHTHYLREAEELARRIIVVDRGAVIATASPQELKARVPGKKITLIAGRPFAPADLDGLPARVLNVSGERASLLSNEPAAVLREVFRRGVDVVDLEVTGADLEEAFLIADPTGRGRAVSAIAAKRELAPLGRHAAGADVDRAAHSAGASPLQRDHRGAAVLFFTFFGLPYAKQTLPDGRSLAPTWSPRSRPTAWGGVMVFGFGIGVAIERGQKVDLLMRATPLPP